MELIEIIKTSISLFSIFSFTLIISSYSVYKYKDRYRIKPYNRVNINDSSLSLIESPLPDESIATELNSADNEEISLKGEALLLQQIKKEQTNREKALRNEIDQHEKILRQEKIRIEQIRQEQLDLEKMIIESHNREQILKMELQNIEFGSKNLIKRFKIVNGKDFLNSPKLLSGVAKQARISNIYDLYSQDNKEIMHKLKLVSVA